MFSSKDPSDTTELIRAVKKGSYNVARKVLSEIALLSDEEQEELLCQTDSNQNSALIWAARKGNIKMVELLLNYNCKIYSSDFFEGESALIWAARAGHIEIVRLLLEKGASLAYTDISDVTFLRWPERVQCIPEIFELLVGRILEEIESLFV
jgi:ankyrin repeat protein